MNVLGLIVEYNPFHNGHIYHLSKSIEKTNATHTVAIMSGNFLQRGEPALFDKYTRAKIAVENGVDLVIELPTLFACQSAEIFSHGATTVLNSLNCINSICFGSEEGDTEILYNIAEILANEPDKFKLLLKKYLDDGLLFPTARANALLDYIHQYKKNNFIQNSSKEQLAKILNSSNNILGIEYIKNLIYLNSSIKPFTISRVQSEYNSEEIDSEICSATAIRTSLKENINLFYLKNVIPEKTYNILNEKINNGFLPMFDNFFFDALNTIILRDIDTLKDYFEVNEGIENKIYKNIFTSKSLHELQLSIKSKRYTLTKIKRTLNNILLGIKKSDIQLVKNIDVIPYIRILAFNDKGREILKEIKNKSEIKIINKFSNISFSLDDVIFRTLISYDIKSTNIYNSVYYKNNKDLIKGPMDFYTHPIYIK
ncbi:MULTISPECIES: nucleotidyltransferase [unclassified Clostridioides]|uniref:nucleotidyltransferase n=1 Tax=unclassified Clostridioides TaxID=2635829 RepID=UPI001D1174EE|nr:nucleotidyltransferase [Clostridioides sp. ES-S-0171-01]MCC0686994.1 nucleotidyltransferase [Clostridioides sp. ES-S-0056-01]MCC0714180.1 nucleotidyltransferase [Clostridioides sp. ES-S-0077-01]UDN55639.1 nucleotidyltransferase [Clostridioides sp. ES-S-0054-01]